MNYQITVRFLRSITLFDNNMKLFIAMPCYQGNCNVTCMESVMGTVLLCQASNIKFKLFTLTSESLIPRARNVCASAFMKSDCSHMLFVDADIIFNPRDVLKMIRYDVDIIAGAYLKKSLNFEKVKEHIGLSDSIESLIEKSGSYAVNPQPEHMNLLGETTLCKVQEAPTGFMMIKRCVFEEMKKSNIVSSYVNDISSYQKYTDGSCGTMWNYFPNCVINQRLLSEDYGFCNIANECNINVFIDASVKLIHVGQFYYFGDPMKKVIS